MNECTVVYSDYFTVGSHTHSITAHVHITCERENIKKTLTEEHGIEMPQVWFVFDGHCKLIDLSVQKTMIHNLYHKMILKW